MPRARAQDVLYVSKSKKSRLDALQRGAQLVAETEYSIQQLKEKAVQDRLALARSFLQSAQAAENAEPPNYRTAVSRAYYAIYHMFRSVSYYYHSGDDYEEHKKLPGGIPSNFPNKQGLENDLKSWRYERNRADYDPYPKNDQFFKPIASRMILEANSLLPIVKQYLRGNGCKL